MICKYANSSEDSSNRLGIQWGALPVAQFSSDQGLTLGLQSRRFDYGSNGILPFVNLTTLQGTYSTLGPTGGLGSFEVIAPGNKSQRLYFGVTGFHTPYQRYFGIGDQTQIDQKLSSLGYYFYTSDNYTFESSIRIKIRNRIELKTGMTLSYYRFSPNSHDSQYVEDFGMVTSEGLYTKLQIGILTDRRNFEFTPWDGYYASILFSLSPSYLGTIPAWARGDLDFRYYLNLISDRWLWLSAQFLLGGSTSSAPLGEKVRLGSQGTLRGLPMNRYLSNYSSSQRIDLRSVFIREYLLNKPLKGGLGTFLDTGHIGDTLPRLFQNKTHVALGISVFGSYFTDDFLCNADIGFSQDGTFIYAGLGHSF